MDAIGAPECQGQICGIDSRVMLRVHMCMQRPWYLLASVVANSEALARLAAIALRDS